MYILIPLDTDNTQEAQLTKLEDVKIWGQLLIENGELKEVAYNSNWEEFENLCEAVVVSSPDEYVWPFMEYNMMVLVAYTQRSIDDIVEAYLFKELHDLPF